MAGSCVAGSPESREDGSGSAVARQLQVERGCEVQDDKEEDKMEERKEEEEEEEWEQVGPKNKSTITRQVSITLI